MFTNNNSIHASESDHHHHHHYYYKKDNLNTNREKVRGKKGIFVIVWSKRISIMDSGAAGLGFAAEDQTTSSSPISAVSRWTYSVSRSYQHLLDRSTPHMLYRWIAFLVVASMYVLRVYFVQGFYIVSYGLGIYILNLLIGFLSPQVDPELDSLNDGPSLPTRGSDEFRPFVRRLPEFKFWYSIIKAFCIAFVMTFFSAFDVPVFWPILLFYWVVLFFMTMRRQIGHMIKYRYVPFSFGKQHYDQRKGSSAHGTSLPRD